MMLYYCNLCDCNVRGDWDQHLDGRRHQSGLAKRVVAVSGRFCDVCNCHINNIAGWEMHIAGRRHQNALQFQDDTPSDEELLTNSSASFGSDYTAGRYCEVCNCQVNGSKSCWLIHIEGRRHQSGGKTFMCLHCEVCNCNVMCWRENSWEDHVSGRRHQSSIRVPVPNQLSDEPSDLPNVRRVMQDFVEANPWSSNYFSILETRGSISKSTVDKWAMELPVSSQRMRTLIGPFQRASSAFLYIDRYLEDLHVLDGFITTNPSACGFAEKPQMSMSSEYFATKGKKPYQASTSYVHPLPTYPIPRTLLDRAGSSKLGAIIQAAPLRDASQKFASAAIGSGGSMFQLSASNFKTALHTLLYIEEAEVTNALHRYDIEDARLNPVRELYALDVDGLAEKRPSVMRGDTIKMVDSNGRVHMGYAHHVNVDNVHLSFDHRSVNLTSKKLVQFVVKRADFKILHRAVDENTTFLDMDWALSGSDHPPSSIKWRDGSLNSEQADFVSFALNPACRLNILWGPPGTGKTTTLVRYLRVLLPNQRGKARKVLVCAPSNAAADYITQRLSQVSNSSKILRVVAFTRLHSDLPEDIRCFALPEMSGEESIRSGHRFPTLTELNAADVIVVTLGTAGRLFGVHPKLKCSHLIVDEAGQATEADLNLALAFCDDQTEHVILAGDPKQLGPVTQSGVAKRYGFDRSPLQRLLDDETTRNETSRILRINYRSHPSILSIVNLHYDGCLVSPDDLTQGKFTMGALPGDAFVSRRIRLFHHEGVESQEHDSPSILNSGEVSKVVLLIRDLLEFGETPKSIVVLTPYLKQTKKIRQRIHAVFVAPGRIEANSIEVCTIEAFQGRESRNIIISCVRSVASDDAVRADIKRYLGFLRQPQRTNVAISRAIDRLWIVGNWNLLRRDAMWARVLFHCLTVLNVKVETTFGHRLFKWDEAVAGAKFDEAFEAADGPREEERGDDGEGYFQRPE